MGGYVGGWVASYGDGRLSRGMVGLVGGDVWLSRGMGGLVGRWLAM